MGLLVVHAAKADLIIVDPAIGVERAIAGKVLEAFEVLAVVLSAGADRRALELEPVSGRAGAQVKGPACQY